MLNYWLKPIHSSDMSIIQKFLTNQIASNEIIIVMTPYCPTPKHLQEGVNLLSLMTFGESKCPGYLYINWNFSPKHYSDVRWCASKWTLGHRRKKREGGYNTSSPILFHYPIFFKQSLTRKEHLLNIIYRVFSLSNELDEENIQTNVVAMLHTDCIW